MHIECVFRGKNIHDFLVHYVTRPDGLAQKILMTIVNNEAFSQKFEILGSAIFRQSKFQMPVKSYPIDLKLVLNES